MPKKLLAILGALLDAYILYFIVVVVVPDAIDLYYGTPVPVTYNHILIGVLCLVSQLEHEVPKTWGLLKNAFAKKDADG